MAVRALNLFCGIGRFAAAVSGSVVQIVGALDQDNAALDIYRMNFPGHEAQRRDLQKIGADELAGFNAGLWWLSPPPASPTACAAHGETWTIPGPGVFCG